jgi:FkbM family methyltransferase
MKLERIRRFLKSCAVASRELGVLPTFKWIFSTAQLNLGISKPNLVSVRPPILKHPVGLRARTSDPFIFRQIIVEDEYRPLQGLSVGTVLDLGANIGLSSAWFLSNYPTSTIFAVEADADNCAMCRQNLAAYGERARVFHGAAWSSRGPLNFHRGGYNSTNQVHEIGSGSTGDLQVQGWDVASLIEMSGFPEIDLLKMDVEGAEEAIFSADVSSWLPRVRNMCIEVHGGGCRDAFLGALAGYDFDHAVSGELDICTNLGPRMLVH